MERWQEEQEQFIFVRFSRKEHKKLIAFASGQSARNAFIKMLRNIQWTKEGRSKYNIARMTKKQACLFHAVASLLDGRDPIIRILRRRVSPQAINILRAWRS